MLSQDMRYVLALCSASSFKAAGIHCCWDGCAPLHAMFISTLAACEDAGALEELRASSVIGSVSFSSGCVLTAMDQIEGTYSWAQGTHISVTP
eukprot:scaffold102008_cov28-Prasinocladus_malaysianus.AAC.1